jgi:hypothetical protein
VSHRLRLRQLAVTLLGAVAERVVAVLARVGLAPERLAMAADRRRGQGVSVRALLDPVPLPAVVPSFVDRSHPSTGAYLESHATWGKRQTTTASIVTAHDVTVSMPTGLQRWHGRPFREGFVGIEALRNPKYLAALAAMFVVGTVEVSEGVLLALPWNHNFFHWLVELLPRLHLVEQVPELHEAPLLVPASAPGFVHESLRLTGYDHRTQRLDDGVYRVGTLHIPSPLSTTADVSPLAMQWLDEHFAPAAPMGRRLYISRGDAPIRYVAQEAQVSAMLEQEFGFETIVMSRVPLEDQVRMFREASVIVGSHGAAFSHLAFAPRGAAVLELFQDGHFNHCYGRMAEIRGLHYGFLVCDRSGLGLEVDRVALRRLVGEMIATTDDARPVGLIAH